MERKEFLDKLEELVESAGYPHMSVDVSFSKDDDHFYRYDGLTFDRQPEYKGRYIKEDL